MLRDTAVQGMMESIVPFINNIYLNTIANDKSGMDSVNYPLGKTSTDVERTLYIGPV